MFLQDVVQDLNSGAYLEAERTLLKGDWISFNENKELFNDSDGEKLLCLFDDGTECKYMEQHPMAILTFQNYNIKSLYLS